MGSVWKCLLYQGGGHREWEVRGCASAGLSALLLIAPFLITRAGSENRVDNWITEFSPPALKMAALITSFLTGSTGSSLSAFLGGSKLWCSCPRSFGWEPPAGSCFTAESPTTGEQWWDQHTTQDGQRDDPLSSTVRSPSACWHLFIAWIHIKPASKGRLIL